MIRFLAARLGQALLVLVVMSFAIYGLIGLMPGDPIDAMVSADPNMTPADAERLRALYGLDRPLLERYGNWASAALSGEVGSARLYAQPVLSVLGPALANSLQLLVAALLLSVAIAVPLGALAASRPRSKLDYGVNLLAFAGISVPQFWLGLLLMLGFAVVLGWLPAGGMPPRDADLGEQLRYLALPVGALTISAVGGHARYLRAAMVETLRQDYVRTARAKGASRARVVWLHALRNALIPFVTILALDFGFLFSGALVIETIFAWQGVGKLIFDAILGNDYNLALVGLLFATALVLVANLLADLCYGWLDPRIVVRRPAR